MKIHFVCGLAAGLICASVDVSTASAQVEGQADDGVVRTLGLLLRCPVCQGMPIGESPAPMAQDMMKTVRRLRHEGHSQAQIEDFFIQRYGAWVLLDPQTQGVALWVWVLPPAALAAGLVAVMLWVLRSRAVAARFAGSAGPRAGYGLAAGVAEHRLPTEDSCVLSSEVRRLTAIREMVQR